MNLFSSPLRQHLYGTFFEYSIKELYYGYVLMFLSVFFVGIPTASGYLIATVRLHRAEQAYPNITAESIGVFTYEGAKYLLQMIVFAFCCSLYLAIITYVPFIPASIRGAVIALSLTLFSMYIPLTIIFYGLHSQIWPPQTVRKQYISQLLTVKTGTVLLFSGGVVVILLLLLVGAAVIFVPVFLIPVLLWHCGLCIITRMTEILLN